PVTFDVQLDREFVRTMHNRQGRVRMGMAVRGGSGGLTVGPRLGIGFASTKVHLLAGKNVGSGRLFQQALHWGQNQFVVPINQGREVVFTIDASGGRSGWEGIGSVTITGNRPLVSLDLDGDGATIDFQPEGAAP
ncbi:MAG: hypothetical protein ACOCZK_07750, partial [Planctomycetota bacterium]